MGGDQCLPHSIITQIYGIKSHEELLKKTDCPDEKCAIEKTLKPHMAEPILDKYFKEEGPRDSNDLLNNFQIDGVLRKCTKQYKFRHIHFQMADFAHQPISELKSYDPIPDIKAGMQSMACVLNTDYTGGGGKHWVCIYVDYTSDPISIEYFNSTGNPPLESFNTYMIKLRMMINEVYNAEKVIVSDVEHQKGDSECGIYSLYYIYSRLNNIPYSDFDGKKLFTDEYVKNFRKVVFS